MKKDYHDVYNKKDYQNRLSLEVPPPPTGSFDRPLSYLVFITSIQFLLQARNENFPQRYLEFKQAGIDTKAHFDESGIQKQGLMQLVDSLNHKYAEFELFDHCRYVYTL